MHIQTPFLRNIISMAVGQLIKKKGYRTAAYNATVAKAAKYSQHLYGKAADIQVQEAIAADAEYDRLRKQNGK